MEHNEKTHTRALVARFVRRRWKLPFQIAGGAVAMGVLMGAAVLRTDDETATTTRPAKLQAGGVVESLYAKSVGAPFDGAVETVSVRPGQKVKKGDLLFRMDTRSLQAALAAARAERSAVVQALQNARSARAADLAEISGQMSALKREMAPVSRPVRPASADLVRYEDENGEIVEIPAYETETETVEAVDTTPILDQLAVLRQQLAERERAWAPALRAAADQIAAADREVKRLQAMVGSAGRTSPIAGLVTAINVKPGGTVPAGQPVVRVDNPDGYRVVTMINQPVREALAGTKRIALQRPDGRDEGKLVKIEAGWDRDLFNYYVWVKPAKPEALHPGEAVNLVLPARSSTTTVASASF